MRVLFLPTIGSGPPVLLLLLPDLIQRVARLLNPIAQLEVPK